MRELAEPGDTERNHGQPRFGVERINGSL